MNINQLTIPSFNSKALKGNPLQDPTLRKLPVYLPPSYRKAPKKHYPVVYFLAGFAGSGLSMLNYSPFEPNVPERVDRLIRQQKIPEIIAVMPDCMTRIYGSQYVNSSAVGRYEDYILEIVELVDNKFRTLSTPEGRVILGKSSGGYGALMLGTKHPDVFGSLACHSGDMYFEYVYKTEFPQAYNAIYRKKTVEKFYEYLQGLHKIPGWAFPALNLIAMAAAYSPKATPGEFDLPFDLETGEVRTEIWQKWLDFDPVYVIERRQDNLRKLKFIYLDCGSRDEYHLHIGARILSKKLKRLGIKHVYEEFEDGHRSTSYRYDRSLELIVPLISEE